MAVPEHVIVHRHGEASAADLIVGCAAFVTDRSSLVHEAGYLGRPVVLCRFDDGSAVPGLAPNGGEPGDGLGPVATEPEVALDTVVGLLESGCPSPARDVEFRDGQCCERAYQAIRAASRTGSRPQDGLPYPVSAPAEDARIAHGLRDPGQLQRLSLAGRIPHLVGRADRRAHRVRTDLRRRRVDRRHRGADRGLDPAIGCRSKADPAGEHRSGRGPQRRTGARSRRVGHVLGPGRHAHGAATSGRSADSCPRRRRPTWPWWWGGWSGSTRPPGAGSTTR